MQLPNIGSPKLLLSSSFTSLPIQSIRQCSCRILGGLYSVSPSPLPHLYLLPNIGRPEVLLSHFLYISLPLQSIRQCSCRILGDLYYTYTIPLLFHISTSCRILGGLYYVSPLPPHLYLQCSEYSPMQLPSIGWPELLLSLFLHISLPLQSIRQFSCRILEGLNSFSPSSSTSLPLQSIRQFSCRILEGLNSFSPSSPTSLPLQNIRQSAAEY
jgi:hypothetical protein